MSTVTRSSHSGVFDHPLIRLLNAFWIVGFLLLGWLYQASPYAQSASQDRISTEQLTLSHVSSQPTLQTKNIEEIRVGERVIADNPDVETPVQTSVNPTSWRLLRLRAELVWDDGTLDVIEETLQPPEWLSAQQAKVGALVDLPLDLLEMGLPNDLQAEVIAIEPCPSISPGTGRVVLTTVNHLNRDVWELIVADQDGRQETIQPTGLHKFYLAQEGSWVSTKDLQRGDQLRNVISDQLTVVNVSGVKGTHLVYNMTVEGEHVYHVSSLGVLAHNTKCGPEKYWTGSSLDGHVRPTPKRTGYGAFGWGRAPKGAARVTNAQISDVGRGFGGHRVLDRIAGEAQGTLSQANRILESGAVNTRWGHIYQRYRGTGGFREFIARRNALHQEAERLLLNNRYVTNAIDSGYVIQFNKGSLLGARSAKGNLLRPDIQVRLPDGRFGILDFTTEGSAAKIFTEVRRTLRS